ncbi:tripartite tricarboxylate transporter permease [Epibacterium sp. SM1979]|uniref:Tripartite tricarboxylate transporter permease n=1 Tax=Tritonibacter litoralis TaxID=2662264 RepID=A0A843Y9B0_9RHOB|nr:tripartite tricarboxylate transporter permease [Tritonibacter litoralis]MQQ07840.1 tripartite tricarboxylate transporter permease [Tritonibacter litoralis]
MDVLANFSAGLATVLQPETLMYCFIGVFLGTFIGVLPGVGSMAAIAMILPLSFYLEPTVAIVMIAGVYYGAEYGGSIASILMNIPGTPSSSITCIDGYPMARQGRAGVALFVTSIASFGGGMIGMIVMAVLSPSLARLALQFGPAEYFAVIFLGLIAASAVSNGGALRGIAMVVAGLMLSTVGIDLTTGDLRFTLGVPELRDGVHLVIVAMGLFGVGELITSIRANREGRGRQEIDYAKFYPSAREWRASWGPIWRGGLIGSFFGALPGTGQTVASAVGYAVEKKVSKNKDQFGKGAVEGVAVPESANNSATQTAFIPTLTLGVPGSASMAMVIGALMIHGITPGPRILTEHTELFWGLVASFLVGNVLLLILNIPLIGLWVRLLQIPYRLMYPAIIVLICIGVYSLNNNVFDIWMTLLFGVAGYLMRLYRFEPAPLLIGFVLGPMMEEQLRRALLLSRGDPMVFLERPISGGLLAISALILIYGLWVTLRPRRNITTDDTSIIQNNKPSSNTGASS